uniref:Ankyrin repeat protein n=1 Tax=Chelonoidis abingdonii TaxID=106734 RepID=A0A8C0H0H5_CHEAB
ICIFCNSGELLSSETAKPKKDDSNAVSIFDAAAKGDLSDLAEVLKENNINAVNASNETLLHIAAANGRVAIIEYLINKGAKLDVKDKKGRTPMHRAAEKGRDDAVKVLLQAGAYIYTRFDAKDEKGQTALGYAISHGFEKTVKVLLEAGANIDSNITDVAFNNNKQSIFRILLEYAKGLSPDIMVSALFKAVQKNLFYNHRTSFWIS